MDPDPDSDAVTQELHMLERSIVPQTVIFVLLTSAIVALLLWLLISAKGFWSIYIVTFSEDFDCIVCLIVVFVCLLCDLHWMSYIDYVVAI